MQLAPVHYQYEEDICKLEANKELAKQKGGQYISVCTARPFAWLIPY